MSANQWIRQIHRWTSIAFTLGVMLNIAFIALKLSASQPWVGLTALLPLIVMLLTGLYLFVLPYLSPRKRQAAA